MKINVKDNISSVIQELGSEADKAMQLAQRELQLAAFKIEREAKSKAPVDTGMMRASITTNGGGSEYEIGTNVKYAPFVEFGTIYQSAQPFFFPSVNKVMKGFKNKVEKQIKSVFN